MEIDLKEITVKKLTDGFEDSDEAGVVAYGGKLDIRPPYQREFIYKDKQRDAVIDSVRKDFPLNVMYWAVREDGHFEVIDGQQRTLSICQYVNGEFSIKGLAFHNLKDDQQKQILGYKLMVYFCSGTDSEKLDWFRTINIAGEEHTDQELRNAVYAGPWTADAKRYFSKTGCPAYGLDGDERHLNIRAFYDNMKREAYERQKGVCVKCKKKCQLDEMEGDHIKPWHEGGKTKAANCQMLCKDDNRRKAGR